ncbi:MAG TPA: VPLPA-CTERM sorting domain-containing protein [Steroidobacteraceae bacterium]|nr:VPLPA-CTERM sorting domain-containing protein [Steroidobacteraceae bacterium]
MKRMIFAVLLGWAGLAQAATVWDESVFGDFSNDGLAPSSLLFGPGSNSVHGLTGNAGSGIDRDYFTFEVAAGSMLTAINVLPDTNVSGSVSFFAIQRGPQVTALPDGTGASALLSYSHFNNDLVGQDLLQFLGLQDLAPGRYSVWVQETGGLAGYGFDFQMTPVPLPAAAWLLLGGLAAVSAVRRRASPAGS